MRKLRAFSRLMGLLAWTAWLFVGLVLRRLLYPKPTRDVLAARFRKRWAKGALWVLGVRVGWAGEAAPEGTLFVANHRSWLDPIILMARVPATFVSKHEVRKLPLVGWGAAAVGVLFVRRDATSSRNATLRAVDEALARGTSVVLFPEGTTHPVGRTGELYPGTFKLAGNKGYPLQLVAIAYSDRSAVWVGEEAMYSNFVRVIGKGRQEVQVAFSQRLLGQPPQRLMELAKQGWAEV